MRKKKWDKQKLIIEIKRISQELDRKPKKRECSHIYASARNYFGTWNNAIESAGFEVKKFQKPKIPEKLTPELSYFIGLLATDGHIVIEKFGSAKVMLFTSYPEEKEIILKLIRTLFNYNASIRTKKYGFNKKPNHEIYISSRNLANYFVGLGIPSGSKSLTVRIPRVFFSAKKLNIFSFIRGVIDGDGCIFTQSKCVRIASGSMGFLNDIKNLLQKIDINSGGISSQKNSNTKELHLSQKENLRKLRDFLYTDAEYFYPRKKESWKNI
jgi:intein/homing endonuclease